MDVDDAELRRLSKAMSWMLRHAADELGLVMDPEGFVAIPDVIRVLQESHPSVDASTLARVVEKVEPAKQRFHIEGEWIRANYGHSLAEKVRHAASTPPDVLLHGTSEDTVATILGSGLRPMRRQYVHLTTDARLAVQVGSRHGRPCLLAVAARKAHDRGIAFYQANERFWLADGVPPTFISRFGSIGAIDRA